MTRVTMTRKVIMSLSPGRIHEWREKLTERFSYIAIDPEINVTVLESNREHHREYVPRDSRSMQHVHVLHLSIGKNMRVTCGHPDDAGDKAVDRGHALRSEADNGPGCFLKEARHCGKEKCGRTRLMSTLQSRNAS